MSKIKNQIRVGFVSFCKLSFLYGFALGVLAGAGILVLSVFGWPVNLDLGSWHMKGFPAGIGFLVLLPPGLALGTLVVAPVAFLPFTFACRLFGGIRGS
jgi:hypothetical protein